MLAFVARTRHVRAGCVASAEKGDVRSYRQVIPCDLLRTKMQYSQIVHPSCSSPQHTTFAPTASSDFPYSSPHNWAVQHGAQQLAQCDTAKEVLPQLQ